METFTKEQQEFLDSIGESNTKEQDDFLASVSESLPPGTATEGNGITSITQPGNLMDMISPKRMGFSVNQPPFARSLIAAGSLLADKLGGPETRRMVSGTVGSARDQLAGDVSMAVGMVPVGKAASTLLGLSKLGAKSGALSGAAEEATRMALGDSPESVSDALLRTAGGAAKGGAFGSGAGLVLGRTVPAALAGAGEMLRNYRPTVLNPLKGISPTAGAVAFKRSLTSPGTVGGQASEAVGGRGLSGRDAIAAETGVDIPVPLSEAIQTKGIKETVENTVPGGPEISAKTMTELKRAVLFKATSLSGANIGKPQDLADETISALESELGKLSAPAKKAVLEIATDLAPTIKKAESEIVSQAKLAVPATSRSATTIGTEKKSLLTAADEAKQAVYNDLYSKMRNPELHPEYSEPKINALGNTLEALAKLKRVLPLSKEVVDAADGPAAQSSEKFLAKGISSLSDDILGSSETQSIEQLRTILSKITESEKNQTIYPGITEGQRSLIAGAVRKDIEAARLALDDTGLSKTIEQASDAYKSHRELFDNTVLRKVVTEFGERSGKSPVEVAEMMLGKDAPVIIRKLEDAIGPSGKTQFNDAVGEFLRNDARRAAQEASKRVGGEGVSVETMLGHINKYEPEMRRRFFKNMDQIRALARRESALAGLKGQSGKVLESLTVEDPQLVIDALGPKAGKEVLEKLRLAFAKSAKLNADLRGTILGAIREGDSDKIAESVALNGPKFVSSLFNGSYGSGQVKQIMSMIQGSDPATYAKLQASYLDGVLSNPRYMLPNQEPHVSLIADELTKRSQTQGSTEFRELTETVLGPAKFPAFKRMIDQLSNVDISRGNTKDTTSLGVLTAQIMAGGAQMAGIAPKGVGALGQAHEGGIVARKWGDIKYGLAKFMLTTPELRRLALTPVDHVSIADKNRFIRAFSNYMFATDPLDQGEKTEQ